MEVLLYNMSKNNLRQETESLMDQLLYSVSDTLLNKVLIGEASSQDIANAIKLLHNNGITVEVKKGDPLTLLSEELPFASEHLAETQ